MMQLRYSKRLDSHLHKWHSNAIKLESDLNDGKLTFAKHQLSAGKTENKCKLLGMPWNKEEDVLQIDFPDVPTVLTKRGVLAYLAKVYDPLGIISPVLLKGKQIFRELCEYKVGWDGTIPDKLVLGPNGRSVYSKLCRFLVAFQSTVRH